MKNVVKHVNTGVDQGEEKICEHIGMLFKINW